MPGYLHNRLGCNFEKDGYGLNYNIDFNTKFFKTTPKNNTIFHKDVVEFSVLLEYIKNCGNIYLHILWEIILLSLLMVLVDVS